MSLASVTKRNAVCHERDGVATVTLYSRDARVGRPAAATLRVEVPRVFGAHSGDALMLVVDGRPHETQIDQDGAAVVTVSECTDGR